MAVGPPRVAFSSAAQRFLSFDPVGVVGTQTTVPFPGPFDPTIGFPGEGGECPPGTVEILGACVGIDFGGDGGPGDPAIPGGNVGPVSCDEGFVLNAEGRCVSINGLPDIVPGQDTPGERGPGIATGLAAPSRICRNVHICPKFADGVTGILYMNMLTGAIVCLPRGMSAKNAAAFGLRRKNRPRPKAAVSAHDLKTLNKIVSLRSTAKSFATKAGFSCKNKAGAPTATRKKKS